MPSLHRLSRFRSGDWITLDSIPKWFWLLQCNTGQCRIYLKTHHFLHFVLLSVCGKWLLEGFLNLPHALRHKLACPTKTDFRSKNKFANLNYWTRHSRFDRTGQKLINLVAYYSSLGFSNCSSQRFPFISSNLPVSFLSDFFDSATSRMPLRTLELSFSFTFCFKSLSLFFRAMGSLAAFLVGRRLVADICCGEAPANIS
ncbi:hypothetical protein BpHYR1_013647 [Brachionus plicatilis]|uniref:Uncharacterized protein n=1 Tax=Brachionus plicatilis TaxID=10195 RepID=A0A3M7SXN8_BRAPC|nr:hypothetical protein BpHYR1_013647 [Brachionus plicatilis]